MQNQAYVALLQALSLIHVAFQATLPDELKIYQLVLQNPTKLMVSEFCAGYLSGCEVSLCFSTQVVGQKRAEAQREKALEPLRASIAEEMEEEEGTRLPLFPSFALFISSF